MCKSLMKRNPFSRTFSHAQDFVGAILLLLGFLLVLVFRKCSFMHFFCLNKAFQSLNHTSKTQQ